MKKELELYLHIPFCVRKCAYCDFLSAPAKEEIQSAYVKKLAEEIREFEAAGDYEVSSVFMGGGTPSILQGREIEYIFEALRETFLFREDAEITIECNPGTLTAEKLKAYKRAGINRLSIGLQSAQDEELKRLGRIHSYQEFLQSFRLAREAGFSNINVDLMSALPGQSIESYLDTLQKVCSLKPEHISAYSLIIEEGTPFFLYYSEDVRRREAGEQPENLPSEEEERRMYYETKRILEKYGYCRYEISNYAKPGFACRHNIGYWKRTDYAGFGLGAASLLNPLRYKNTSELADYLKGDFSKKELLVLTKDNQIEETLFLGLRMTEGVNKEEFEKRFSCPMDVVYRRELDRLQKMGLLEQKDEFVRLTEKGMDVSNRVLAEFLLS